MEIAASIKSASKEYKAGDTVITALQPTTIDFMKKELSMLNEKQSELVFKQIELINNSGALSSFIENLR